MRNSTPEDRFLFILMCVLIMMAGIGTFHATRKRVPEQEVRTSAYSEITLGSEDMRSEAGPFRSTQKALSDVDSTKPRGSLRTLQSYYQRRALLYAPPIIPHEVSEKNSESGKACLSCHEFGGFAEKFDAYTPVTPHPEWITCRQCHVPHPRGERVFQDRASFSPPKIHQAVFPHSPPVIPHDLHLRENCLSCHGGSGAVEDIRTSHAERINCRQCHVLQQDREVWVRSVGQERHE